MAFACPRHFTTLTGAPTGRLCWWDFYFVCRSWCSLSLRKNSPRIHTFSRRRTNWFAAQAHRRLQIDPKEKPPLEAALKIKKFLEPLKYTDSRVQVCFFFVASLPPPSAPICEARVFHLAAGRAIHIFYSNLV
jgi:hypothetical protein